MFVSHAKRTILADGLLKRTEERRRRLSEVLAAKDARSELGQFFTPRPVGEFLAGLFDLPASGVFRLLDPGAGIGSLTAAVVARALVERPELRLDLLTFEIDGELEPYLRATLDDCEATATEVGATLRVDARATDFVAWAADAISGSLFAGEPLFSGFVMNPPYRKVNNDGADRRALEGVGVTVTNVYAAFLALASRLLEPGGQLTAITPRSFANGVYFKPFRQYFLQEMAFDRLHVYERRGHVFADAQVLQENVVFRATRRRPSETVLLSTSVGRDDGAMVREVPYSQIVHADDPHLFIRIPVDEDAVAVAEYVATLPAQLDDLGIDVSTGRVVDFRAQAHLRMSPEPGTVPLIYPTHLRHGRIRWPQPGSKKPNALAQNDQTGSLLLPNETYVLVKRFTAKEERRRVVASLVVPEDLPDTPVAFENHLNVYHVSGRGLPLELARGLVAFLNSEVVDRYVRQFSGHTQINAADLRQLRYPSADALTQAGRTLAEAERLDEGAVIDRLFGSTGLVREAKAAVG